MSDFVMIEGNEFRISSLAEMTKDDFVDTYTGVIMDVKKAWKEASKYAKKKPNKNSKSED
jgi:hypothetical protein